MQSGKFNDLFENLDQQKIISIEKGQLDLEKAPKEQKPKVKRQMSDN